jgi:hypothetical protein
MGEIRSQRSLEGGGKLFQELAVVLWLGVGESSELGAWIFFGEAFLPCCCVRLTSDLT